MLLLGDDGLEERRRATRDAKALGPLYDSLAAELEPLLHRELFVPTEKALLSRAGGRCERDGSVLEFDPWSPHQHRCLQCGTIASGSAHHRAWIMSYQLWLAERAVHASLFHLLHGDAKHGRLARDILSAYCERYLEYPNRDNVLGPTRVFFSTYLESIWLLQICVAADMLERAGDNAIADLTRERIIAPSRDIIAGFDEGMSNRQVWNNAALFAAAVVQRDSTWSDRLIHGPSGLHAHLSTALLRDGTWYEGENYHQFALRGLWYGVVLAESAGHRLPAELGERFQSAFAAPFATALPDFTMPSRKDSQYAVSLRQWRLAELTELGFGRRNDAALAGGLARCYEAGHERRDTGRARSTADVERNGPPSALTRADLGWRALLHALPELRALTPLEPRSTLLDAQGYAVFRRAGDVYVGLDYGQSGGGHGHPDRLNLTLYHGATRWLDDMGTGSYVDPSLHWYRSTLAHNAPLVDGKSQPFGDGELLAYDEREGLGWIVAAFTIPDGGVRLERTLMVAPDYLIDELRWTADRDVRVELPWHLEVVPVPDMRPAQLEGGARLEDGFAFVTDIARWPQDLIPPMLAGNPPGLMVTTIYDGGSELFSASGPGQPPTETRRFLVRRMHGESGQCRTVLTWQTDLLRVHGEGDAFSVEWRGGERHVHRRDDKGWHVELFAGGARSSVDLGGFRSSEPAAPQAADRTPLVPMRVHRTPESGDWLSELTSSARARLLVYELAEPHYRRSEDSWTRAGSPRASVAIAASAHTLVILARVAAGKPIFAAADATNPYDNEHPDTMRAGIQLHLEDVGSRGDWMLVPESGGHAVRVRAIGASPTSQPKARWRETADGYEMRIEIPLGDAAENAVHALRMDVIINETIPGRERRRGQLVMSGARGEFVYLRGDRHDPARLIPLEIVP